MKKILIVLLVAALGSAHAQEVVSRIPIEVKDYSDLFSIIDDANAKTYLFFTLKKKLKCMSVNSDMHVQDTLTVEKPDRKFETVLGHVFVDGNPQIYWSSSDKKKVVVQSIDFKSRSAVISQRDFDFTDEKYIDAFVHNGQMYLMTVPKKASQIILYAMNSDGNKRNVVDLSNFTFHNKAFANPNKELTFIDVMSDPLAGVQPIKRVHTDSPPSLNAASHRRKYYLNDGNLIVSLDLTNGCTQVITIPLDTFKATVKKFDLPELTSNESRWVSSNSSIVDNLIFQVKANEKKIYLRASNLSGKQLGEYTGTDDQPITFKNGEIVQENGFSTKYKTIEKSSKYLSKISALPLGVSAYKFHDNYVLTIGGIEPEQQGMAMYGMFGLVGGLLMVAILNSTQDNFTDYANRRVVYLNSHFGPTGKHIPGEAPVLAFEKMKSYVNSYAFLPLQSVVKKGEDFYLGYLHVREKKYVFVKFTE